jgi:phosphonate transport system substrate-binding protein
MTGFQLDRRISRVWLMLSLSWIMPLVCLTGCDNPRTQSTEPAYSSQPPAMQRVMVFGVHPLHNPQKLDAVYGPLVAYLNSQLGDVKLRLEASRDYGSYEEKLFARQFEFALPNPYQTLRALKHGYKVFGRVDQEGDFRGIVVVRRDSAVRNVADLSGKTIAYPAPTALAATMMPQFFLRQNGLDLMRETQSRYVGSQESSILNVYHKDAAAAATWPPPWRAFVKEHPTEAAELKVMWETEPLPGNSLVVRNDVPPELVARVARLLTTLHESEAGRSILAGMEAHGIAPATEDTYAPVRAFLDEFSRTVRPLEQP